MSDPAPSCGSRQTAKSLSLTVLPASISPSRPKLKHSKSSRWRALALILVHVFFIIHIAQWYISGLKDGVRETFSPVEPSEAMYTLERGLLNSGFVFFAVAILTTLIFGRFFCGWGCHIVALQDLCGWLLKKLRIHPKPFRTRLLLFMPLALALYMFVRPTLTREVIKPAFLSGTQSAIQGLAPEGVLSDAFAKSVAADLWTRVTLASFGVLDDPPPRPVLESAFIVEDFWRTFPPWWVAIPFILICCFAIVVFLGNKGFCTYACPYGGFFGPADLVSPGKIVVNDNCEGCGHCTAVCTSNVRVHEEVRDYGKVVDPGCMKCLDCVSVCPNNALSFALAAPTIFTKPKNPEAKARRRKLAIPYDLTRSEELWVGLLFVWGAFFAFRGFLGVTPLLLSAALGIIVAFGAWKLASMLRFQNVRLSHWQLRVKGRVTWLGWLTALVVIAALAAGAWSTFVRTTRLRAAVVELDINTPSQVVFSPTYTPNPFDAETAARAIQLFERSGPFWSDAQGATRGLGWTLTLEDESRLAWLHSVRADWKNAVARQKNVVERRLSEVDRVQELAKTLAEQRAALVGDATNLAMLRSLNRENDNEIAGDLRALAESMPGLGPIWIQLALRELNARRLDDGLSLLRKAAQADLNPGQSAVRTISQVTDLFLQLGRIDDADKALTPAIEHEPKSGQLRFLSAIIALNKNQGDAALKSIEEATTLEPTVARFWALKGDILDALSRPAEAQTARAKARELSTTR